MSEIGVDIDERSWERYLSECRAGNQKPSLSDYMVWLSDQDLDEDEPGY